MRSHHAPGAVVVSLIPASPERSLLSLLIRILSSPFVSRTNFYDRSLTSRRYALVGMACSGIFGCSCIVASIITLANQGVFGVTNVTNYSTYLPGSWLPMKREILALALDLIVTLCTESIGFVHGISLRSALASESRLHFNTNLRLLTAARGWYNPNGALLNVILAVLLVISYSSVSFIVIIALSAMRAVKILTWSSSPFDLTAALVHHTQLSPVTLRHVWRSSEAIRDTAPAWHAHPSIRKVVIFLWVIVAACAGWAALVMYMWNNYSEPWGGFQWTSFLTWQSNGIQYPIPGVDLEVWILLYVNMAAIQGPLTLGLHCSELIANVIRDERQWRYASTRKKGLTTATNPVKTISSHPICLILFVAKPFLRINSAVDGQLAGLGVSMFTAQIWNLCIALFIFACVFTFVALRRPRGPQPAAYGHLQTLANLVDEWSPVMWWGHKEDGIPVLSCWDERSPAAESEDGLRLCWFRCWVSGTPLAGDALTGTQLAMPLNDTHAIFMLLAAVVDTWTLTHEWTNLYELWRIC
ncbi:uncharacterized protein BJ212DRAFT_1549517 [Suillus subaureus]|uniref:Uncharacterized protein n=1 Tax=Suillus subaureus TaxID=48587 RepID=A0A9P7DUM3_9AGAM|nr:uncharacterized protein BJ212DRAFT_1549517 [Suillus subaureus]KAG1803411.1 hypothetical protein BJ212DRAFT_1549517 [Suillus subaureus]